MTEQEAADKRWQKRVSAQMLGERIKNFKTWLGTSNGQLVLVGTFVVVMFFAGIVEQAV